MPESELEFQEAPQPGSQDKLSLSALLSVPEPQTLELSQQQQQFRLKMAELARGLLDGEYWQFLKLLIVESLEDAKDALESESTDDRRIRICQGKAQALRALHNSIIDWSKVGLEEDHER